MILQPKNAKTALAWLPLPNTDVKDDDDDDAAGDIIKRLVHRFNQNNHYYRHLVPNNIILDQSLEKLNHKRNGNKKARKKVQ